MVEFYKKGWWPQAGDYYWWQGEDRARLSGLTRPHPNKSTSEGL